VPEKLRLITQRGTFKLYVNRDVVLAVVIRILNAADTYIAPDSDVNRKFRFIKVSYYS
jgi:hypothetical protein